MKDMYDSTYHRDRSVTLWDIFTQTWLRTSNPSDEILASLSEEERVRTIAHTHGLTTKWQLVATLPYSPVTDNDGPAAGNIVEVWQRRQGSVFQEQREARNGYHISEGKIREIGYDEVRTAQ